MTPTRLRVGPIALVVAALLLAVVPLPAGAVERWYSSGIYEAIQPVLTTGSNAVALPLFDAFVCIVLVAFVALMARDLARLDWMRAGLRAVARLLVWSAALYIVFLIAWGLNYRRVRLEDRLPFDRSALTAESAARLAAATVDRLNALHAPAHAAGWTTDNTIDLTLADAFERAMRRLRVTRQTAVGRPKHTLLDWYFQRAGVSGMTDPLFLETLVAGDLLPFERPFVIAHEWAHLGGLADEGEANLAGWLACLESSPHDQYSGWLFMYGEALGAVPGPDRAAIAARLGEGPRSDLRAIRDRTLRHVSPRVSAAGWRMYDSYLKVNRVEAGTASYDQVVRLALGLRAARVLD